ncbi:protein of unknown function [Agrobacterium pusense]|uniref:Uncharacterized protein n=1 Tax=Agrobacterium pusense TaxID=648995 RepID=U4Q602_9HYPH|nr:protein of unknown function [Agrobacterium pusense]
MVFVPGGADGAGSQPNSDVSQ